MGAAAGRHTRLTPQPTTKTAGDYARQLLDTLAASFGVRAVRAPDLPDEHPALTWARSGMMALTGRADADPQMCPVPLAACADGALAALAACAPSPDFFAELRGSRLLAERAAIAGHVRAGAFSPGGSCRLLAVADGVIALNLAREDDWALLPAWLEAELASDWDALAQAIQQRNVDELVLRGRLLGLALAASVMPTVATTKWWSGQYTVSSAPRLATMQRRRDRPLVLDLSSLWAGPLCSHLLQGMGADVIKVESTQRPDGARRGPAHFFDVLNAGKRCVALDFNSKQGREQLRALIGKADIVIEGSRPRALRQLGIHAETCIDENPGLSWIALSGYGREKEREDWIAFGDDAAVAAGLSQLQYQACGEQLIVGDAIADPLTGLHAALLAWACHGSGGGQLLSLALHDVVNHCIRFDLPDTAAVLGERQQHWTRLVAGQLKPPNARQPRGPAHALGADTDAVLTALL